MASSRFEREEREVIGELREQGWETEETTKGHWKCRPPEALRPTLPDPWRTAPHVLFGVGALGSGLRNGVSRLKRAGYVPGLDRPVSVDDKGSGTARADALTDATAVASRIAGLSAPRLTAPSVLLAGVPMGSCECCGMLERVRGECCPKPEGDTFGAALRFLREEEGIHQSDLADIVETTQPRISCIERNVDEPGAEVLARLYELFPRLKRAPTPHKIVLGPVEVRRKSDPGALAAPTPVPLPAGPDDFGGTDFPDPAEIALYTPEEARRPIPTPITEPTDPIEELWELVALAMPGEIVASIFSRRIKPTGQPSARERWEVKVLFDTISKRDSLRGEANTHRDACMDIARRLMKDAHARRVEAAENARKAAELAASLAKTVAEEADRMGKLAGRIARAS